MKKIIFVICFEFFFFIPYSYAMGRKPPVIVEDTDEGKIASHFHINEDIIISLENEGYSDEEIIKILILATTAEKSIKEVTKLYSQGMSWEEIAQDYGIDVDVLNEETSNILLYYGKVKKVEKDKDQDQDINIELLKPKKPKGGKLDL